MLFHYDFRRSRGVNTIAVKRGKRYAGCGRTVIYLDDGLVVRVDVGERGRGTPCRIPISCVA
jgi:hypothetical protein